jgi:hypothetical protein
MRMFAEHAQYVRNLPTPIFCVPHLGSQRSTDRSGTNEGGRVRIGQTNARLRSCGVCLPREEDRRRRRKAAQRARRVDIQSLGEEADDGCRFSLRVSSAVRPPAPRLTTPQRRWWRGAGRQEGPKQNLASAVWWAMAGPRRGPPIGIPEFVAPRESRLFFRAFSTCARVFSLT